MNSSFIHLHVHSHFSLLDGTIRLEDLLEAAHQDKMEALALTDHGNLFGALEFFTAAKDYAIKPIIGCEVYLAPQSRFTKGHPSDDEELPPYAPPRSGMTHLLLLCENEIGYQNLCKIVSLGYLEGFYYRPRVDREVIQKHSEGLIATSACMKGEISSLILMGNLDKAKESLLWYQSVFKDRFYLELQQNNLPQQMILNERYQEFSRDFKVPLLATSDVHYLKKEDAYFHEVLMNIGRGRTMELQDRSSIRSDEFYFKTQSIVQNEFSFCPEAVHNSLEIANRCRFEFKFTDDKGKKIYHFPKYDPPVGMTAQEHFIDLSEKGLEERFLEIEKTKGKSLTVEEKENYDRRLKRELQVINDMGFTGYFLIVSDFIRYAKTHEIPVGPGRGSGAGSLVAYSLKITELDPIEHQLLFERFLNPERVSLPDFDVDFCMDKRDRMIEYVTQKYGKDCVAQIITFGKLQARGVIRDVGRVFGISASEVDKIAKLVPETLAITLDEALAQEPRLKQLMETDPRVHEVITSAKALEGLCRHASIHAAGLVISNRPMVEHCPLYRGKNDELVIQFDMNNADRIGLIKFDFLGLKTLTFLEKAENLIRQRYPQKDFRIKDIPLEDAKMYEMLSKGDTFGVFQLESSGMQDLLKRLKPTVFGDIVAINALYRPGPIGSGMLDDFIGRKHGTVPIVYEFEELREILQETYGVIVYQEQVQQIAMRLASYTAGGADLLRRAMGKKKPEEMAKQKRFFVEGALKNGFNQEKIEKLFDLMEKFAGYGFNKSHAAAYSLVTCQTAYIKAHFPVEFFATLLSIEKENTDKITRYISDSKKHGIQVLRPDVNESLSDFTVLDEQTIRFGLGAIKGVGQVAIESVLETRHQKGVFNDLFDLCSRTNLRTVNKRVLEAFTKAGAFDGFKINRASLFKAIDSALTYGSQLQKQRDEKQDSFGSLFGDEDPVFTSRQVTYPNEPSWPKLVELTYEKETIGFYVTGHPLDDFQNELKRFTSASLAELKSQAQSKECFVGGLVVQMREIFTKKGDRMAFLTLEDKSDVIEVVAFSDVYLENEALIKSQEPLWIKGTLEVGEDSAKLILSKKNQSLIKSLKHAYEAMGKEIHVFVSDSSRGDSFLNSLNDFLKEEDPAQTHASVFLHVKTSFDTEAIFRIKKRVSLSKEVVEPLKEFLKDQESHLEFY